MSGGDSERRGALLGCGSHLHLRYTEAWLQLEFSCCEIWAAPSRSGVSCLVPASLCEVDDLALLVHLRAGSLASNETQPCSLEWFVTVLWILLP